MRRVQGIVAVLVLCQANVIVADDREIARQLRRLIVEQQVAQAEKLFDEGLKEYPNSILLRNNGYVMYSAMLAAGKGKKALIYLDNYIDHLLDRRSAIAGPYISRYLQDLDALNQSAAADKKLDGWLKRAEGLKTNRESVVANLLGHKAIRLSKKGKKDEADALVDSQLAAAKQRLEAAVDDPAAALGVLDMLLVRVKVRAASEPKKLVAALDEYVGFAAAQVEKHGTNARVLGAFFTAKTQQINRMLNSDANVAEEHLAELEAVFDNLDASNPAVTSFKRYVARELAGYKSRIATAKKHNVLLGKPAVPIGSADWVNGEAISDEDLKGKVVLIDFWAVWCGPCIRTFPHLREWQEKYSDKGLVILGATRYYKRHQFEDGKLKAAATPQTTADEQKTLVEFAKHHKLKHRFAVIAEGNPFHSSYGVSGIPQAVVIDRKGVVRLIRVGSGEANARELHEMIKKCLAEGASE